MRKMHDPFLREADIQVKKKYIVAHPGKQHSFRTASALKKANMLCKYVTTIYNSGQSRSIKFLYRILPQHEKMRIQSRRNPNLEDCDVVQYCVLFGYFEIFLSRIRSLSKLYLIWQQINANFFGKKVAKLALREKPDGVILYDTNAKKCFEILKKKAPSIKRIVDVTHINRIYQQEQVFRSMQDEYENERKSYRFPAWFLRKMIKENESADIFLAPSEFVKKSLVYSGIPEEKIIILPYGSNFEISEWHDKYATNKKLEFIFVGKVSFAKGIPYLLEAFGRISEEQATLRLVGAYDKDSELYKKYGCYKNIIFEGAVLHNDVLKKLKNADVFILPSLMEGMSLAGLEAMSCGLPVICTKNSGLDQFVHDDNGFLIDSMNVEQLYDKIMWFILNRERIPEMSKSAYKASRQCTWNEYDKNLTAILSE